MFTIDDTETNPDVARATSEDGDTLFVQSQGSDYEGRTQYRWEVWIAGRLAQAGDDFYTGVGMDAGPERMLATFANFLSACAESYEHTMRTGRPGENNDLFNARVAEWAYQNNDELTMLATEIEENTE